MPDLTLETYWYCMTCIDALFTVKGSGSTRHAVSFDKTAPGDGWQCDCKGFQYRHRCKHIEQAKPMLCAWHEFTDGGNPVDVAADDEHPNGKACPMCGCEVKAHAWGV